MSRRLRILWSSSGVMTSSGYATQSREILYRMLRAGYPVAQVAFYGLEGGIIELDGLVIYPRLGDDLGEDACIEHAKDWQADVTFSLQDIWPLNPERLRRFTRWIPYAPIDWDPLPPRILERLPLAYDVITHSRFGHRMLERHGVSSTYIPYGVDTAVFRPLGKRAARDYFDLPGNAYLFGMVAVNIDDPSRKSFQEVLDAFKLFHRRHPRSALLMHNNVNDAVRGFPIDEYVTHLGLEDAVYRLPVYTALLKLDRARMAKLYSALDCLLAPAAREGFGLPIIEAQACGVPVIVNDNTAMPELVGAGAVCAVGSKRWNRLGSYSSHPDVRSLHEKMEALYRADRGKLATAARRFVLDHYDMDTIFEEQWKPYLTALERRVHRDERSRRGA